MTTWAAIRSAAHAADRALRGPAARAISDFVGVEHDALETGTTGGPMVAHVLEDAYSPRPSAAGKAVRTALATAFAPVGQLLPETLTLYRAQAPVRAPEPGVRNGTVNPGPRSVLSWSFSRAVADDFADGGQRLYPVYTDDELHALIATFHRTGRTQYHSYTVVRTSDPAYADIFRGDEYLTDTEITDGIWPFMADNEADRRADNAKIEGLRQRVLVRQVPRDAIVWITDRAGQQEAIVLNTRGRPWYVDERGTATAAGLINFCANALLGPSMSVTESLRRYCVIALPTATGPKVTMQSAGKPERGRGWEGKYVLYLFNILCDGKEVAQLYVKFLNGDVTAAKVNIFGNMKNQLGTATMRGLFNLLKKRFPKLETIYGDRISGARKASGKALNGAQVRLRRSPVESALARYCATAFYDHRSDMGTRIGGDNPVTRVPAAPPPLPKPAPPPAAEGPKKGPPVPPGKGKAPPPHKGKAPPPKDDADEPEDEAAAEPKKGGKEKPAPKPHKGPAPKLKPLRV